MVSVVTDLMKTVLISSVGLTIWSLQIFTQRRLSSLPHLTRRFACLSLNVFGRHFLSRCTH